MSGLLYYLIGTFALSAVLTPVVRQIAIRLGRVAAPRSDRWHTRPVAMLGGFAIVSSVVIALAAGGAVGQVLPLFAGALAMFALGAVDDELHFGAATKLVAQTVIALGIVYLAPPVELTGLPILDELIALGWVVGITNAFNLLDNMDGLSSGIAAIAGSFYLVILLESGPTPLAAAVASFTGAALGFLIYNFQPAKIFMGDSGSLFLGSFLGGAALFAAPGATSQLAPIATVPLLILLIPIFDTAFVTITRRMSGRPAMVGGRDHLSHRLVGLGMPERLAVLGLYALAALGGLIGISLLGVDDGFASIVLGAYLILLAGIGLVLGHVEAHAEAAERISRAARRRTRVPEPRLRGAARRRAPVAGLLRRVPRPFPGPGVRALSRLPRRRLSHRPGLPALRAGAGREVPAGVAQFRRRRTGDAG